MQKAFRIIIQHRLLSRAELACSSLDKVVIATKFGFRIDTSKKDAGAMAGLDGRPEHVREVAEAS